MSKKICLALALVVLTGCPKKDDAPAGDGGGMATTGSAKSGLAAGAPIKLGQTMAYSGPASSYGVIGKGQAAYFKMINDKGGIRGHKIEFISVDDGYNPSKTVEQTRKLVESDNILAMYGGLGTGPQVAVQGYLEQRKIPQLFVGTGADRWADPKNHPWTIGFQPSYRTEGKVYATYLLESKPAAKLCVLNQNDDFGKDYLAGLKDGLGDKFNTMVTKQATYEVTDPTVDSQIVSLQAAGCDALLLATTPKFAAQAIRKVYDIGWKPLTMLSNVCVSITAVMKPAGLDKSKGIISAAYLLDPSDPKNESNPGMQAYKAFMKENMPETDVTDSNALYAFVSAQVMMKVLEQCGDDFSRENIMKQATNLRNVDVKVSLPGIEVTTSPTDYKPYQQMQLARFTGTSFEFFGKVLSAD